MEQLCKDLKCCATTVVPIDHKVINSKKLCARIIGVHYETNYEVGPVKRPEIEASRRSGGLATFTRISLVFVRRSGEVLRTKISRAASRSGRSARPGTEQS